MNFANSAGAGPTGGKLGGQDVRFFRVVSETADQRRHLADIALEPVFIGTLVAARPDNGQTQTQQAAPWIPRNHTVLESRLDPALWNDFDPPATAPDDQSKLSVGSPPDFVHNDRQTVISTEFGKPTRGAVAHRGIHTAGMQTAGRRVNRLGRIARRIVAIVLQAEQRIRRLNRFLR